jgi:hypothetical protein
MKGQVGSIRSAQQAAELNGVIGIHTSEEITLLRQQLAAQASAQAVLQANQVNRDLQGAAVARDLWLPGGHDAGAPEGHAGRDRGLPAMTDDVLLASRSRRPAALALWAVLLAVSTAWWAPASRSRRTWRTGTIRSPRSRRRCARRGTTGRTGNSSGWPDRTSGGAPSTRARPMGDATPQLRACRGERARRAGERTRRLGAAGDGASGGRSAALSDP